VVVIVRVLAVLVSVVIVTTGKRYRVTGSMEVTRYAITHSPFNLTKPGVKVYHLKPVTEWLL
jgi:hypothetical protein